MFQGSANVPESQHFAHIEKAGGSLNGSTWLDRTNYYETLPSHFLELGLWLEADRMGWLLPAMTQDKLDNQRDVVKNERRWRVDNQPYGDWDERIQAMMYPPDHPYHHSVIGSMADLDAASLEDVEQFFRTYYAPNNAVLTICGDFEDAHARELVERYFGEIPPGPPVPGLPGTPDLPELLGGACRDRVVSDVPLARVYRAYRIPPYGTPAFYAAAVASHALGSGKASRLYRTLVREQRIAQDIAAYAFPIVVGGAMLVLWATAKPGVHPAALERALDEQIAALAGTESAEIERAVHMLELDRLEDLQRVGERADQLSMFETLFGDPGLINSELDRYRAVTADAVRAFAQRALVPDNSGTIVYVPTAGGAA
jgi:predicted Zn-dependent peptidase